MLCVHYIQMSTFGWVLYGKTISAHVRNHCTITSRIVATELSELSYTKRVKDVRPSCIQISRLCTQRGVVCVFCKELYTIQYFYAIKLFYCCVCIWLLRNIIKTVYFLRFMQNNKSKHFLELTKRRVTLFL